MADRPVVRIVASPGAAAALRGLRAKAEEGSHWLVWGNAFRLAAS